MVLLYSLLIKPNIAIFTIILPFQEILQSNCLLRRYYIKIFKNCFKGIDAIDPFIPLETKLYTQAEADGIYNYYKEKNWITGEKGTF